MYEHVDAHLYSVRRTWGRIYVMSPRMCIYVQRSTLPYQMQIFPFPSMQIAQRPTGVRDRMSDDDALELGLLRYGYGGLLLAP